ncbi:MAG TPA: hypothetical protein VHP11_02025 [Tepidisphaeraceae bacterium]|nr:hypothetical protein [Tepidisphaeraceae bacterium]
MSMSTLRQRFIGFSIVGAVCLWGSVANASLLVDVTTPGDVLVALSNTAQGTPNHLATVGTGGGQHPAGEPASAAIDNNQATKYLNFGRTSVGFAVTPSMGATYVTGLRFSAANDAPERDPISFTLEGCNSPDALTEGFNGWTPIAYGFTGLTENPGRNAWQLVGTEASFADAVPYTSYRLLITTVRTGSANSMQVGEVELLGCAVPEPASLSLLAFASLLVRRRRI